jgi:hypothetical protein
VTRQEDFEEQLRIFVNSIQTTEENRATALEVSKALIRLKTNKNMVSGDPNGIFTYEDPVLATAAEAYLSQFRLLPFLGRGSNLSHWNWIEWAGVGITALVNRLVQDADMIELSGMVPIDAITVKQEPLRLAVVGDAGFNGFPQENVCRMIKDVHRNRPFNFLIHLGDIYFAGSADEMLKHFLDPFKQVGPEVLALCGNHDLYGGAGPFKSMIRTLKQPGRYFEIKTKHWRIVCLDTSLASFSLLRGDGRLDIRQLDWLSSLLMSDDKRCTVLMSHHFIRSAWGKHSPELHQQLSHLVNGKIAAWYWGHEHACATYERGSFGFYGACVGNGAFVESWKKPDAEMEKPSWYAQGSCRCFGETAEKHWQHGFLELELFADQTLIERFHLEDGGTYERRLLTLKE